MTSPRTRLIRAATVGYQGFGNLGDEAILSGIEACLRNTPVRITTVFCGMRAPVPAAPEARRIVSRRLLPGIAALRELRRSDLLLLSGGGLINDHWPQVIPRYLLWSLAARIAGCRVIWVAVGVGPIRRGFFAWLATRLAARASLLTVRDEASAAWLRHALPLRPIHVVPDPALLLDPAAPAEPVQRNVAVVVRPPTKATERHTQTMLDALAGCMHALVETGSQPVIVTFGGAPDRTFARVLADKVVAMGSNVNPEIVELAPDPQAALRFFQQAEAVITVRLHGLILASVQCRPWVAISYDDKVREVAAELGARDLAVPIEEVTEERLMTALRGAKKSARQHSIRTRVAELRTRGTELSELIVQAGAAIG